ncbi:MAG TPA: hypothetical protein VI731_05960 [Bacteroidia bacterium]|nr:hypothetical protein [Bacteroidia bacterium]
MSIRLLGAAIFILFFGVTSGYSQSLEFIGLKGIFFGMRTEDLTGRTIILDTTSTYKDTLSHIRRSRCHIFFLKNQDLQLAAFKASRIEYEFCDSVLSYVFIHVKGNAEMDKAVAALQTKFKKLRCKNNSGPCVMDAHSSGLRCIVKIDRVKQEMSFVLISKRKIR